jgi:HSP20 family protein
MTLVRFNTPTPGLLNHLANQAFNSQFDNYSTNHCDCSVNGDIAYQVTEQESVFTLEIAVPGLTKSDLKIEVDNSLLTVSTVKIDDQQVKTGFAALQFEKRFRLSKNINTENIVAQTENGLLTITLSKAETAVRKPARSIEIA